MSGLGDRRVVLVTGKGGVGKTTVSVALAMAAARRGKRVLLCETQGSTRVPALFGRAGKGYEAAAMAQNLWTLSITSNAAIQEYVLLQLHFQRLYKMVFQNRVMGPFVDAVPGLHDLVQLGKVWFAERETENGRPRWDLIVVDAPATGHGLSLLGAPRAMMDLTRAGPFYDNARQIAEMVEDAKKTALVLVTLPEEMPIRETEELHTRLGPLRRLVAGVVLNEVHPEVLPPGQDWPELRRYLRDQGRPELDAVVRMVDVEEATVARQADARRRLGAMDVPLADLPFAFRRNLGRPELEGFSRLLEGLS